MTRGERFTPFLAFPPELRRVIYTTNSIESLNYQLRKITQEPRPLPQRSRGRQAALAGDLRHRRQTSARPGERAKSPHRATQSTRTPRRGPGHDELETSTATALTGLPRPRQPPPLITMTANAYTKNLTGSQKDQNDPLLSVTMITTGSSFPSSGSTGQASTSGRPNTSPGSWPGPTRPRCAGYRRARSGRNVRTWTSSPGIPPGPADGGLDLAEVQSPDLVRSAGLGSERDLALLSDPTPLR